MTSTYTILWASNPTARRLVHPTNHPIDLRLVRCVCRWCLSSRSGIFLSFDVIFQWPQLADRKIHFRRGQEVKLLQLSYLVCPLLLFVWMKRVCVKIGLTDLTVANQPSCFCFGSANLRHEWWAVMTSNHSAFPLGPFDDALFGLFVGPASRWPIPSDSDVTCAFRGGRSLDAEPLGDVHCYSCNLIL